MRRRLGGLLLLLSAAYLLAEAVTAAGWTGHPYDPITQVISDLGVPECRVVGGQQTCSPWHGLLGAALVLTGLRAALAGALLLPLLAPGGARRWVGALTGLYALGLVLVAAFPLEHRPVAAGGDPARGPGHGVGALLVIVGGAVLLVAVSTALRGRARVWALVCAVITAGGVLAFVTGTGPAGVTERVAVYGPILWQVGAGIALLRPSRHLAATSAW